MPAPPLNFQSTATSQTGDIGQGGITFNNGPSGAMWLGLGLAALAAVLFLRGK